MDLKIFRTNYEWRIFFPLNSKTEKSGDLWPLLKKISSEPKKRSDEYLILQNRDLGLKLRNCNSSQPQLELKMCKERTECKNKKDRNLLKFRVCFKSS